MHGILRCCAVCRKSTVDIRYSHAALDRDGIVVAVVLIRLRRASAARMTAVEVGIVARGQLYRIIPRGVARTRDAAVAVRIARERHGGCHPCELIRLRADTCHVRIRMRVRVDVALRRIRRRRDCARVVRHIQTVWIGEQRHPCARAVRCELRPVQPCARRPRDAEHRRCRICPCEVKVELLEAIHLCGGAVALDAQRVVRTARRRADHAACNRTANRSIRQLDGVVRRRAATPADDITKGAAAVDVHGILRCCAVCRKSAVDIARDRRAALYRDDILVARVLVFRCRARACRPAAVDIRMRAARKLNRILTRGVAADGASAPSICADLRRSCLPLECVACRRNLMCRGRLRVRVDDVLDAIIRRDLFPIIGQSERDVRSTLPHERDCLVQKGCCGRSGHR